MELVTVRSMLHDAVRSMVEYRLGLSEKDLTPYTWEALGVFSEHCCHQLQQSEVSRIENQVYVMICIGMLQNVDKHIITQGMLEQVVRRVTGERAHIDQNIVKRVNKMLLQSA